MTFVPSQLGHLVIRVRDLDRSEKFYTEILGLTVQTKRPGKMVFMSANTDSSHELALFAAPPDANGPDVSQVGLVHMAWRMATFEDLEELYQRLKTNHVPIKGIGDHRVALGVYFLDPDGIEIEAFYEMPKSQWPVGGDLFKGKFPRSLEEVLPGVGA